MWCFDFMFHKWGKWEDRGVTDCYWGSINDGAPYKRLLTQERRCTVCNKLQTRKCTV